MNFKLTQPGYYSITITAPTPDYADRIVAEMVKKGYSISPGLGDNQISMTPENGASSIIVLAAYNGKPDLTLEEVYKNVTDIFVEYRIGVYSVIIAEYAPCMFGGTNIIMPKKAQPPAAPPTPPVPEETRKKMN